jgi:hypothetical protein
MKNESQPSKEAVLEWELNQFEHEQRGKNWYIVVYVLLFVAITLSIFFKQWSLLFVIFALSVAVYRFLGLEPNKTTCEINDEGIRFNDIFHSYPEIKSFAISYEPERFLQLFLNKHSAYNLKIVVPEEISLKELRDTLAAHIPEQAIQVDMLDRASKILKL